MSADSGGCGCSGNTAQPEKARSPEEDNLLGIINTKRRDTICVPPIFTSSKHVKDEILNFYYPDHLVLDDIHTWPKKVRRLLTRLEPKLHEYRDLESKIDTAEQLNSSLRVCRRWNEHERYWSSTKYKIHEYLNSKMIIGFHCTRLTEIEIKDIKKNGLKPLSVEHTISRINKTIDDGLIAKQLIQNNEVNDINRKGRVCFFHSPSNLNDEVGLCRLFRAWGGEAIYVNHEKNKSLFSKLTSIGKPCIVVASIFPNEVNDIEKRIISVW